jgi:hypothetical protein
MTYELPSFREFLTIRRLFPVSAGVLFVGALAFPMWHIAVDAVQYPSNTLHLNLYAYPKITGDYVEVANLNKYVGFYYPDPVLLEPNYESHPYAIDVPEWSLGPLAFLLVGGCGVFVALAPSVGKLKTGLKYQVLGTVAVFGIMLADIQYRLHQAGHTLDPDAPVMGVDGFTPPIWGKYEVANITSHSRFGTGVYVSIVAVALLVVAFRYRDSEATPVDPFRGAASRLRRLPEQFPTRTTGDRRSTGDEGTTGDERTGSRAGER